MQNTFDNADKAEKRREERRRQLEHMDSITSGRNLPTFVDEDASGDVRSGAVSPVGSEPSGALFIPPDAADKWGESQAGDEADDEANNNGSGSGGGGGSGSSPPSRRTSGDSATMEKQIADGMHAPPLGATDIAQKFLWDEDEQGAGGKRSAPPSRGFGADGKAGGLGGGSPGRNLAPAGGGVGAGGIPTTPGSDKPGIGSKLLRGLVPTFGPDGGRGGAGSRDFTSRAFNPPPSTSGSSPSPGSFRSQSLRAFGLIKAAGGGGGPNLAPRRNSFSGGSEPLTNVDLTKTPVKRGGSDVYDYDGRYGGSRYAGYDDENLPPLSWTESASAEMNRAGRTVMTAVGGCCAVVARKEVRTCIFFVVGVAVTAAIATSLAGRNGGGGGGGAAPPQVEGSGATRGGPPDVAAIPPATAAAPDSARLDAIVRRVVDSGASHRSELSETTAPKTPQRRAAEWLSDVDGRALDPADEFLLQRYSMAVLWYGTHDEDDTSAKWRNHDHWMTDKGVCAWHGVTCREEMELADAADTDSAAVASADSVYEDDGVVSVLSLETNNILGELPRELFTCLVGLTELDLHGNELFGTIGTDIGRLRLLQDLDLGDNSFEGRIPTEIGGLDNLVVLDLGLNVLTGPIPREIADLFDTLEECSLFANELTGTIPNDLSKLERLESLYLDTNNITGTLPTSIGKLTSLLDLRVRDNDITGPLPAELGRLTHLQVLYVDTNSFAGPVPWQLSELTDLEELNIYDNLLSGSLPPEYSQLTSLKHAYLDTNDFVGPLPSEWFEHFPDLINLYVDRNGLSGEIPTELGLLTSMEILQLGSNEFVGTIPEELGTLEKLTELGLEDNRLEGTVPESLGLVVNIETLLLHGNSLTGEMPGSVCQLVDDHALDNLTAPCLDTNLFLCDCCSQCY